MSPNAKDTNMLVFFALGNTKVLSFALCDAKVPNANGFASQWNIGFILNTKRKRPLDFEKYLFSSTELYITILNAFKKYSDYDDEAVITLYKNRRT